MKGEIRLLQDPRFLFVHISDLVYKIRVLPSNTALYLYKTLRGIQRLVTT